MPKIQKNSTNLKKNRTKHKVFLEKKIILHNNNLMLFSDSEKNFKNLFLALSLAVLSGCAFADSFRVHKVNILELPSEYGKKSVKCGVNDAVAIKLPKDMTFIQGVELSVKVPQIVTYWTNSVAWGIFDNVSPLPQENKIDYSASRIAFGVFGTNLSLNLKIPLFADSVIKKDAYSSKIENIPKIVFDENGNGWFFLRMQLAMKGTDDDLINSKFEVSARPILRDKGFLKITALTPNNSELQKISLQIDGKDFDFSSAPFLLDTGSHTVSIQSDFYRNELRSITVEQAKSVNLEIQLRDITPAIRIASPSGSKIFIDDEEIPNTTDLIPVSAGDHVIKFVIGNYEITKVLSAINGRNYNININLDALITEEE